MLEYLRNAADKPVAKILMGVLIFSFVGWGVAEWIFKNTSSDAILKIGNREISVNQFNVERNRAMYQLDKEQQKKVYTDPVFAQEFNSGILAKMTKNEMILARARDLGFFVSEKRIVSEIKRFPEFSVNGKFTPQKFDAVLASSGLSEKQFADYLSDQVLSTMVLGSISVPVKVPEFAVVAAYNARYSERQIDYSVIRYDDYKISANPTDAQLKEYYAQNPKIIPETRDFSYVLVAAKMDTPDAYDRGYVAAQKLEDAIISGDTMSMAAAKNNAKYSSFQSVTRANKPSDTIFTDSIVSKIFSMDEGMESELIETKQGFVILRVNKINPEHTADFASVKAGLVSGWTKSEQKKQAYIAANESLVKLNKTNVLDNKKTAIISRASGAPLDVLSAAYSNAPGINTIVPGADAFYVVHIEKEIPAKADSAKMAALRRDLQNMSNKFLMEDYNSFLTRKYPIHLNKKMLNKMFAVK